MSLQKYNSKRDFTKSPEPKGGKSKNAKTLAFVIQRHKASRLHYDFRLEMEGVLKSWAVPKGPSLDPTDKRLAMMVEDHPFDYKDFSGIIPSGYGAGIVEIWDKGTYTTIENENNDQEKELLKMLKEGNLKFTLKGKKLKGEFALVKLKKAEDNSWLLIKHRDKYAVDGYDSEEETPKNSPINKWLSENKKLKTSGKKAKPQEAKKKIIENFSDKKVTNFIEPMLAKETSEPFDSKEWLYEIKWDGYRAIAQTGSSTKLYSRNGNNFLNRYPPITNAISEIEKDYILDGEIVVLNEEGHPDFQKLQHYENFKNYPIAYYVFDILKIGNKELYKLPLIERKNILKDLFPLDKEDVIKFSDHILNDGIEFFKASTQKDLEGIMAKRIESLYYPGKRTTDWLKIKNHKTADVLIAGFTDPAGSRKHFGSLILGIEEDKKLIYVGNAGTGYDEKKLNEISTLLKPLIIKESPFSSTPKIPNATWVKPEIVCEVKFSEWTSDRKLRHPVFLRLRDDKDPKQINMKAIEPVKINKAKKEKKSNDNDDKIIKLGKINVSITHPAKIYFPKEKITKGDVVDYYQSISEYILPYLKDRPQSLNRTPNGMGQPGFFHKDAGENAPSWIKSFAVHSESTNKEIDYIICNNKATLAYLNNLGCIELNPWHSQIKKQDNPDYMIIDLDPSENNTFEEVIETALHFKKLFDKIKVPSFCKTSGASGIHVYVPMGKKYGYEQVKNFANIVCSFIENELPKTTTLIRTLKKRDTNKIYLDYLQNRRGQTIASVYSARPKEGATVSMPLLWKEVKPGLKPSDFTIKNALKRIQKTGDIFKGVLGPGINMEKALKALSLIR